ncbi:MAG: hypothetical protein IH577_02165 [Deltaproteobacteria bacterium]|nr:hypothetical protein [Deltaproteobacteria bacterium]
MRTGTRPIRFFPPPAGRRVQRAWIPATALCLAVVMAVLGSSSRDAMSAILSSMPAKGVPAAEGEGAPRFLPAAVGEPDTPGIRSRRYLTRIIVLVVIIVLIVWLIYRSLKGWRPMISRAARVAMPPRGRQALAVFSSSMEEGSSVSFVASISSAS